MSISVNTGAYLLSSLLPYPIADKKEAKLSSALQEYLLLVIGAKNACEALETGDFPKFDALVGENMCQIRAIKIAMIAKPLLKTIQPFKQQIHLTQEKVSTLIPTFEKAPKGPLQELFQKHQLDIQLNEDQAFLIQSYLLSVVKVIKPPRPEAPFFANEETNVKNLQSLTPVSSSFANALVKHLREYLSSASVEFVRACAKALPDANAFAPMVSEELVWRRSQF